MGRVMENLENLCRRRAIILKARRELRGGETWVYPLELKKNVPYLVEARCSKRGTLRCSVSDSLQVPLVEGETEGGKTTLSVIPQQDGPHKLRITVEAATTGSMPERVSVTLKKEPAPSLPEKRNTAG